MTIRSRAISSKNGFNLGRAAHPWAALRLFSRQPVISDKQLAQMILYPVSLRLLNGQPPDYSEFLQQLASSVYANQCELYQFDPVLGYWGGVAATRDRDLEDTLAWLNKNQGETLEQITSAIPNSYAVHIQPPSQGAILICDGSWPRPRSAVCKLVADELSTLFNASQEAKNNNKQAIWNERAAISSELHDSLAQSLSYLKIQVTRLGLALEQHTALAQDTAQSNWRESLQEIRSQLGLSYRQLRELMSTFRLTLNGKSVEQAIEASVEEFSKRSTIVFSADVRLTSCHLGAEEELHLLQIVREALANIVRHSQASNAHVKLINRQNNIELEIGDNGQGMPQGSDDEQHYGLVIMQERAARLNAKLSIQSDDKFGTKIKLAFSPKSIKNPALDKSQRRTT